MSISLSMLSTEEYNKIIDGVLSMNTLYCHINL
jgi:hypothetical protein